MKKYIGSFLLVGLVLNMFSACTADEGQTPGSDSSPVATLYQYDAAAPYNADNDCFIRVAANSATAEAYYFAELASDKTARKMSDAEYADYVVANGTKLDKISGASIQEVYMTDLHGQYVVSVVAKKGNAKCLRTTTFAGLDYKPLGTGSYDAYFLWATGSTVDATGAGVDVHKVNVEYSEVGDRYRLTNVFSPGTQFSFSPSSGSVYPAAIVTGCSHPKYGPVSANSGSVEQQDEKTFVFTFTWRVSAGSFGQYDDTLTLD